MFKKILILYVCIVVGSFLLASLILQVDFTHEKVAYGSLFSDYKTTVYKGIGVLCVAMLPIFMNVVKSIREHKIYRWLSFFLWPVLIFILETSRSNAQEIRNTSVVYFSVFVCLLLGFIYFQRWMKRKNKA